mgnify:CR=1 FL=1
MFDRKEYMKNYYRKNKEKLKKYSSEYKKGKEKIIPVEVRRGTFLITFN